MCRVISGPDPLHDLRHRPVQHAKYGCGFRPIQNAHNQRREDRDLPPRKIRSFRFFPETSPSMVRWNSQIRYAAPSAIPTAAQNAQLNDIW